MLFWNADTFQEETRTFLSVKLEPILTKDPILVIKNCTECLKWLCRIVYMCKHLVQKIRQDDENGVWWRGRVLY